MSEQRTADGVQLRGRIDRYLDTSGLGGPNPRVVPLTGDASDRRYFRVIPADGLVDRARSARRTDRLRLAAVRESRGAAAS